MDLSNPTNSNTKKDVFSCLFLIIFQFSERFFPIFIIPKIISRWIIKVKLICVMIYLPNWLIQNKKWQKNIRKDQEKDEINNKNMFLIRHIIFLSVFTKKANFIFIFIIFFWKSEFRFSYENRKAKTTFFFSNKIVMKLSREFSFPILSLFVKKSFYFILFTNSSYRSIKPFLGTPTIMLSTQTR